MGETHKFKLAGKAVPLKFTRLRGSADGWTYLRDRRNPHTPERILIDEQAYRKGRSGLELLVHELLHALNPQLSEEAVTEQAADITRVLWVLGWRRSDG